MLRASRRAVERARRQAARLRTGRADDRRPSARRSTRRWRRRWRRRWWRHGRQPRPAPSGFSGTVQYMAPEQLDGDAGDHRADIFAFGCVLYEMLAGRKAFEGAQRRHGDRRDHEQRAAADRRASTGASAARPRAEALPREGSRAALAEHRRCHRRAALDRRPIRSRPPAAAAAAGRDRAALGDGGDRVRARARGGRRGRRRARACADAGAAPDLPALRLEISTAPTDDPSMALSPDGTQLAFVANRDRVPVLWVRALDAVESRAARRHRRRQLSVLVAGRPHASGSSRTTS